MKLIPLRFVAGSLLEGHQMKHVSYKDYEITVSNTKKNKTWRSHVTVTWYAGKFDLHDEFCFTTEVEAEEHGVELGKHWVNNRIQSMRCLR
jgi:hypothetical protein